MSTAVQGQTISREAGGERRRRRSAEERRQLVERAVLRLADGVSFQQSAKDFGVSYETLRRWRMAAAGVTQLRRVTVKESAAPKQAPPSALQLVTASGHRVKGLELDALVELLRRLG